MSTFPEDANWPRAGRWLRSAEKGADEADLALIGVPAHRTSITPTGADATPAAVREALMRYSTYAGGRGIDISALRAIDLGDVQEPDGAEGEERVRAATAAVRSALLVALGGDNSITYPVMRGLAGEELAGWGLVTVDAHHDLRDGQSNGSPVRRLIEAGLPGSNVVQVGIADFSNSAHYEQCAREGGITVIRRSELRAGSDIPYIMEGVLDIAGAGGRAVYVDLDVDVCDRAEAPACPSAAPGGITADELRRMARLFGRDPRVRGIDVTEVDATADAADGRTVRLAALLVLEAAAGLCERLGIGEARRA